LQKENPFRLIAVSRPGYLRTPLEVGTTAEDQADALAALLDSLGIERVAVVGISGGGPATLMFALRHPERCWALAMVSAVSGHLIPQLALWQKVAGVLLNTDPGLWLFGPLAEKELLALSTIDDALLERISEDPEKLHVVMSILHPLPASSRRAGFNADMKLFSQAPRYPIENVRIPTLVVHGTADMVVPREHGEFVANGVPGAELLLIEGGGHLCAATHKEQVLPRVIDFLSEHAPTPKAEKQAGAASAV
jgi:pimeloyl-ACP methyl ester carboxylesterase